MNKDGLKAVAKAAGVDYKFTNSKGKKQEKSVDNLRKDIKGFLAAHEGVSIASLLGRSTADAAGSVVAPAQATTVAVTAPLLTVTAVDNEDSADNSNNEPPCSVCECACSGAVICSLCNLPFCREMHAIHDGGHRLQTLRDGLQFSQAFELPEQALSIASVTAEEETETDDNLEVIFSVETEIINSTATAATEIEVEAREQTLEPNTKKRKTVATASSPPTTTELEKVVYKVRSLLSRPRGTTDAELKSALNFGKYDIPFLCELATAFGVNISEETSARRTNRERVLKLFIEKLLNG